VAMRKSLRGRADSEGFDRGYAVSMN